jgi:hypothetical protein
MKQQIHETNKILITLTKTFSSRMFPEYCCLQIIYWLKNTHNIVIKILRIFRSKITTKINIRSPNIFTIQPLSHILGNCDMCPAITCKAALIISWKLNPKKQRNSITYWLIQLPFIFKWQIWLTELSLASILQIVPMSSCTNYLRFFNRREKCYNHVMR